MAKQQEVATIVSGGMNSLILEFVSNSPARIGDDVEKAIDALLIGQKLVELKKAVDDVLRDATQVKIDQADIDLLNSYYEQAKSLVQGWT